MADNSFLLFLSLILWLFSIYPLSLMILQWEGRLNKAIHWINQYSVDMSWKNKLKCPLDNNLSDLSGTWIAFHPLNNWGLEAAASHFKTYTIETWTNCLLCQMLSHCSTERNRIRGSHKGMCSLNAMYTCTSRLNFTLGTILYFPWFWCMVIYDNKHLTAITLS